jgi:hypothetical protein
MTTLVQLLAAAAAADMWMDFSSFWTPSGFIDHTVPLGYPCSPRQAWMNSHSHMKSKHVSRISKNHHDHEMHPPIRRFGYSPLSI